MAVPSNSYSGYGGYPASDNGSIDNVMSHVGTYPTTSAYTEEAVGMIHECDELFNSRSLGNVHNHLHAYNPQYQESTYDEISSTNTEGFVPKSEYWYANDPRSLHSVKFNNASVSGLPSELQIVHCDHLNFNNYPHENDNQFSLAGPYIGDPPLDEFVSTKSVVSLRKQALKPIDKSKSHVISSSFSLCILSWQYRSRERS